MTASPMAVAVQQLTRELDACKKRIRKMEKENEKLRLQLQAAVAAPVSSNGSETVQAEHGAVHQPENGQTDSIEFLVDGLVRQPSQVSCTSPLAPILPSAPKGGENGSNGKTTPNNGSVTSTFIGSPGSPQHAGAVEQVNEHQVTHSTSREAPLVRFDSFSGTLKQLASTSTTSTTPLLSHHLRSRSYEPQVISLGGSINVGGPLGAVLGGTAPGGATHGGAAHLAALRRRVEAYEEREVSWREQLTTLTKTIDTIRRDHMQQIDTLEETIETLQNQLKEATLEIERRDQQLQQPQAASSPPTIGVTPPEYPEGERSMRRRSMVVLRKTSDIRGRDMLIAELPKEDLDEDIFMTHSNHVRTISNNLVPFSALTEGHNSNSSITGPTLAGQIPSTGSGSGGQPGYSLVNPNQLGEAVPDNVKNKRWYLQNVIKLSLFKVYSDDKASQSADTSAASVTLQGKSLNSVAAMVKESFDLHYYIKNNAIVQSDVEIANLPPFHKQNSDAALLQSFSSSTTGTTALELDQTNNGANDGANDRAFPRLTARADQVRVTFTGLTLFRYIRTFLHFDLNFFLHSLVEATWRESVSPGKSDASMYFFGHFVIKSVKEYEYRFLKDAYVGMFARYSEINPHTLISKFYSLFSVYNVRKGTRTHFVVMNNVFWTRHYINRIFDIKGSSAGRDVDVAAGTRTAYGALLLKDNDLPSQLIICGPMKRATLLAQLRSDTSFLASLSIVDYSCVIGIRTRLFTREQRHQHVRAQQQSVGGAECGGNEELSFSFTAADGGILSLPIYAENDTSTVREDTYYIGLIDVLQMYTAQKRLEHFAKGLLRDKHTISVVPPGEFSERLCKVLERITV